MQVKELWIHPVKSMQGMAMQQAEVLAQGFAGDRQWLVADVQGRFITARELEPMLLWQPALHEGSGGRTLLLQAPDGQTMQVCAADYANPATVTVWRDTFCAWGGPPDADAWLSARLGRDCRLLYLGQHPQRMLAARPQLQRSPQPLTYC